MALENIVRIENRINVQRFPIEVDYVDTVFDTTDTDTATSFTKSIL